MPKPTHTLTENQYLVTHFVDEKQTGMRLDSYLKGRYRKRSREQIKRAIEDGVITIDRNQGPHATVGKLKPSYQLMGGDQILVLSERKPEPPVCFDYKIVFEDEVLFIIDKPSNLPVHPAGRYFFNTLLVHLKTEGHRNPVISEEREFFLVHRIDKETSGVLVLTKDKEVCTHLTNQFKDRTTEKRYLAIVRGVPPEEFSVDLAMKRSTESEIDVKMMIAKVEDGGQEAFTRFKRLEVHGDFSLIECFPKTGRQHQIRLHLESAGHPIVGDKLYGMPEEESLRYYERQHVSAEAQARLLLPRHALHASSIRFVHPLTGKRMEFSAKLPAILREFLDQQSTPASRARAPALSSWAEL